MLTRREWQACVEDLRAEAETLPDGHPAKAELLHQADRATARMLEMPELTEAEERQVWADRMQAFADEQKAEADNLPEGHPEKAKLLHHAEIAASIARTSKYRAFFEADGEVEDLHEAARLKRAGLLN
jgi:hypothetical protein